MNETARKLLIVEDDPIIANIYRNKFEKAGFEVEVAPDGQTGFYRIHEAKPNVVLLDLMLPHMNGLDILKKIRAQKRFANLPVFVFTNAYLSEYAFEASRAGANHVFNKANTTPQQIVDAVRKVFFLPADEAAAPAAALPQERNGATAAKLPGAAGTAAPRAPIGVGAQLPSFSTEGDDAFQAELRQRFMTSAPDTLASLRKLHQAFCQATDPNARQSQLQELYRKVHSLTGAAAITELGYVAQMSAALEALVKEIMEKPKNINASTQRTIALTLDFLGTLLSQGTVGDPTELSEAKILVVDDEVISRRAVTYALEKAKLKGIGVEDPAEAYRMLSESSYDLVFLDVDMPDMDGFELCKKLRALEAHKTTPVIFVTSLTDFESRAKSILSGGNELIGKPFLFIELAVKALACVMRARVKPAGE